MDQNQKPMSLEKLPGHLQSLKEKGEIGSPQLVNMGSIVTTNSHWKRFALAAMLCLFLSVGSIWTYDIVSPNQFTVLVDMEESSSPLLSIPKIVADSGGRILSVKQNEGSSVYEVKVSTRKSRRSFLEWLRRSEDVKKVELEE